MEIIMAIFRDSQGTNSFRKQKQMEKTSIHPAFPVGTIFMARETSVCCLSAPSPHAFLCAVILVLGPVNIPPVAIWSSVDRRCWKDAAGGRSFSLAQCAFLPVLVVHHAQECGGHPVSFSCTPTLHMQLSIKLCQHPSFLLASPSLQHSNERPHCPMGTATVSPSLGVGRLPYSLSLPWML